MRARAGCEGHVRRHGGRHRVARRFRGRVRAGRDWERRAQGQVAARWCAAWCCCRWSAFDAWRVISRRRPSVVIGVGGYSSGPVVALAAIRGIPTLLMEQNAMPGLTNRLLARVVQRRGSDLRRAFAFFGGRASWRAIRFGRSSSEEDA